MALLYRRPAVDRPGHHRPRASGRDSWSYEGAAVGQHVESAVLLSIVPRTPYCPTASTLAPGIATHWGRATSGSSGPNVTGSAMRP